MSKQIVGYVRVSTDRQGKSGLGLDAQRTALQTYAQQTGATILRTFEEVESGRRNNRPELAKALAFARRAKATLVVAKLDRLARNVAFTSALMESGVDFIACDNPHANRLTIHVLAAVAEDESRRISERTKAALKEYVKRGGRLGSPVCRLTDEARERGRAAALAKARGEFRRDYGDLAAEVVTMRRQGKSLQHIASALNAAGHQTRRGAAFTPVQVSRVLKSFA